MALPLSITLNISGEAIAKDYRYAPSMSVFDGGGSAATLASEKDADKAKPTQPLSQLFVPYAIKITRADIVKGGEFIDPKKVTDKDLVRALSNQASVVRMLDYAEARSGTKGVGLDESASSGVLKANVDTVAQLLFKDGKQLKLQGEVYTIYSNKMVSWKLEKPTTRDKGKVFVVMELSVVKGAHIGIIKKQRLLCPSRRANLRESIKAVTGKDLMGEPAKKPLKTVPRRLIQSPLTRSRSSRSSSSSSRRSADRYANERLMRLLRGDYSRGSSGDRYSRSPIRRVGGRRTRKRVARRGTRHTR